jgi:small subunit ribosomal protein S1
MSIVRENDDVLFKIVEEEDDDIKKQQQQEAWEMVYAARQNSSILKAELRGTEQIQDKLCGIVYIGHVKGIIPLEFTGFEKPYQLMEAIGQEIYVKVLKLDRVSETFIGSRIAAIEHLQGLSWDRLQEGLKLEAKIIRVNNRSLKLDVGAIEVTLPIEEVSYEWIDDLNERFKVGQTIRVKVVELDKKEKILKVSHKELLPNPWPDCTRRYQKGTNVSGRVSGVVEYGVFVNLEPGVDALCPQPAPSVGRVKKGDKVLIRISNVDPANKRISARIRKKV